MRIIRKVKETIVVSGIIIISVFLLAMFGGALGLELVCTALLTLPCALVLMLWGWRAVSYPPPKATLMREIIRRKKRG